MAQQDQDLAAAIAEAEARLEAVAATAEVRQGGFDRNSGAVVWRVWGPVRPWSCCTAATAVGAIGSTISRRLPNTSPFTSRTWPAKATAICRWNPMTPTAWP